MNLTRRQQEFLRNVIDLYREAQKPLHYSIVAERSGVSPITAYDMLRLLEERGFVESQYVVPESGSGRSTVVFSPTIKMAEAVTQLAGQDWDLEEWERVKDQILSSLRSGRGTDYYPLLEEILVRIPERHTPMLFVTEMIAAILLTLFQLTGEQSRDGGLIGRMRALGLPAELGLNALAGLAVGLSFVERANRRVRSTLFANHQQYQDCLQKLSADNRQRLSAFAQEVIKIVEA